MMREAYLQTVALVLTVMVVGLFLITRPSNAAPAPGGGCDFYWCYDVNRCGTTFDSRCNPGGAILLGEIRSGPHQCLLCEVWGVKVYADEYVHKWWYDVNGDKKADCEYQRWWAIPKGFTTACEE